MRTVGGNGYQPMGCEFVGAVVVVGDTEVLADGVAVGTFVGAAVIVVDAKRRAVGDAVGAFVGAVVIVANAE